MKKTTVYIVVLALALSALLSGCGENIMNRKEPAATDRPQTSAAPETMMPDPEDGVVRDEDGIITDEDSGKTNETPGREVGSDDGETVIPSGSNDMETGNGGKADSETGIGTDQAGRA